MNGQEIIEMAREARLIAPSAVLQEGRTHDRAIEAFAKLVTNAAIARERDACAKICEEFAKDSDWPTADNCAEAIRARSMEV